MYSSTHISGKKAKKFVEKGAMLFDTRSPVQYRDGTLPGAISISPRQVSSLMKYPKNTKLIFFGDEHQVVETMVNYATNMGFLDVYTFGTMENWDK